MARARTRGSQCALPVTAVNHDGSVTTVAPFNARMRNSSGKRRS